MIGNKTINSGSRKEAALLALMHRTGYNIVQENGQRKYGPPPDWTGSAPKKGCEVFVGKIPRDCYEDELVPVFESVGKIFELRLMMDFSGSNRGYAFLMYTNTHDAHNAIKQLNNYEIRPKKMIGVVKSIDNCRLFVGGIPRNKTKFEIIEEMRKVTNGVVDAIVYTSISENRKNRGFAFVEYDNHRAAAMARRKLLPGKIQLWGHDIAVNWADPEPQVDEETMSKVTVLYIRNLNLYTQEEQLREIFSFHPLNLKVEKVKKLRDFAFVHYASREDAENALQLVSKMNFCHLTTDGQHLEVTWAKPANSSNNNKRRKQRNLGQANHYQGGTSGPFVPHIPISPAFGFMPVLSPMAPAFEYAHSMFSSPQHHLTFTQHYASKTCF